jgi:hypothetical protein
MDNSDQFFRILGPNKIWLSADARAWAQEFGMTDQEMGKYLLSRSQQSDDSGPQQPSLNFSGAPSTNIEDRRQDQPYFDPVLTALNPNPQQPPLPQQATPGPSPLGNQLGYGAIGQSPPSQQQPNFYGPSPPSGFLNNPSQPPLSYEDLGF